MIDIFKRISPAVVSVANKAILRDLFSMRLYEVPQGAGSGFMWDKKGHIIVAVDGAPIRTNDDFLALMDRHQAGDKIKVTYTRNKEKRTVEITVQDLE